MIRLMRLVRLMRRMRPEGPADFRDRSREEEADDDALGRCGHLLSEPRET
jgi:hypothetical protein